MMIFLSGQQSNRQEDCLYMSYCGISLKFTSGYSLQGFRKMDGFSSLMIWSVMWEKN